VASLRNVTSFDRSEDFKRKKNHLLNVLAKFPKIDVKNRNHLLKVLAKSPKIDVKKQKNLNINNRHRQENKTNFYDELCYFVMIAN
jgi:hypothetical protein